MRKLTIASVVVLAFVVGFVLVRGGFWAGKAADPVEKPAANAERPRTTLRFDELALKVSRSAAADRARREASLRTRLEKIRLEAAADMEALMIERNSSSTQTPPSAASKGAADRARRIRELKSLDPSSLRHRAVEYLEAENRFVEINRRMNRFPLNWFTSLLGSDRNSLALAPPPARLQCAIEELRQGMAALVQAYESARASEARLAVEARAAGIAHVTVFEDYAAANRALFAASEGMVGRLQGAFVKDDSAPCEENFR